MDAAGNSAMSHQQVVFVFGDCLQLIKKIVNALSEFHHGFAVLVSLRELLFCIMKRTVTFHTFPAFPFAEILFQKAQKLPIGVGAVVYVSRASTYCFIGTVVVG